MQKEALKILTLGRIRVPQHERPCVHSKCFHLFLLFFALSISHFLPSPIHRHRHNAKKTIIRTDTGLSPSIPSMPQCSSRLGCLTVPPLAATCVPYCCSMKHHLNRLISYFRSFVRSFFLSLFNRFCGRGGQVHTISLLPSTHLLQVGQTPNKKNQMG